MSDINAQIARLQELTRTMVGKHEQLINQNKQLFEKVTGLERDLRRKNSELALMEQELKTAKVARGITKGGDEAELAKAKIGSLMREIDRCIALLNE